MAAPDTNWHCRWLSAEQKGLTGLEMTYLPLLPVSFSFCVSFMWQLPEKLHISAATATGAAVLNKNGLAGLKMYPPLAQVSVCV